MGCLKESEVHGGGRLDYHGHQVSVYQELIPLQQFYPRALGSFTRWDLEIQAAVVRLKNTFIPYRILGPANATSLDAQQSLQLRRFQSPSPNTEPMQSDLCNTIPARATSPDGATSSPPKRHAIDPPSLPAQEPARITDAGARGAVAEPGPAAWRRTARAREPEVLLVPGRGHQFKLALQYDLLRREEF